jgi:hypothetical protein
MIKSAHVGEFQLSLLTVCIIYTILVSLIFGILKLVYYFKSYNKIGCWRCLLVTDIIAALTLLIIKAVFAHRAYAGIDENMGSLEDI